MKFVGLLYVIKTDTVFAIESLIIEELRFVRCIFVTTRLSALFPPRAVYTDSSRVIRENRYFIILRTNAFRRVP